MSTMRRLIRPATALLLAGGMVLGSASGALAQAQEMVIPLDSLGVGETTTFFGRTAEVPFTIPVPPGTTPEVLTGTFQLPIDFTGGFVELYSGGNLVASFPLEAENATAGVEIPLDQVEVAGDSASFTLRAVMDVEGEQWCREIPELSLLNGSVLYSGEAATPETVADFLPPILSTLSIYVPSDPSQPVQQAALELATSLESVYRASDVDIQILDLPGNRMEPGLPGGSLERQIVFSGTGEPGIELVNGGEESAFLRINGEDGQVGDQARLLADPILNLTSDNQVTASGFPTQTHTFRETATLNELGYSALTAEGVGQPAVYLTLERARFQPFVESADLTLTGAYTPLGEERGGEITVTVGGNVVDRFPADDSGEIDRDITIPGNQLGRYTDIAVAYRTTGDVSCGTTQPVALTIDGESSITVTETNAPSQAGFQVFPEGLLPTVDVAMSGGTASDLSRAASILTGVQSLSNAPLQPRIVSWDEAVGSSNPTVFIDADGNRMGEIPRHLAMTDTTLTPITRSGGGGGATGEPGSDDVDSSRQLTMSEDLSAGSLQAVWDAENARMILAASSNQNPVQLDRLLDWLGEDAARWAGLQGDVLVQAGDRAPMEFQVETQEPRQLIDRTNLMIAIAVGALIVIVAIVALLIAIRRFRR